MEASVIIVSYNTAHMISDCITSVQSAAGIEKEIIIVDNASTDQSVEMIKLRFPAVKLIINKKNMGFGAANNQALSYCHGKYLVYLNPDTTVAKDTVYNSFLYMETNQQVGLAGAKILNPDGKRQPSVSYRYPGEKYANNEASSLAGNIACVMGAFMIARKSLIDELHGFDEDFFLYGEDQDLCWRIREKGLVIGYINNARVVHLGGQSELSTPPPTLFKKKLKAEYLFYKKHYLPETINRIKKSQRLKARYRLATLKILLPFAANRADLLNKVECYKIALKMAQEKD